MKRIILLCFVSNIGLSTPLLAQDSPEDLIETFAQKLANEGSVEAVDFLFSTNEWLMRNQDSRDQISTQLSNLLPLIGDYHGREQIATKQAGQSLVLYSYLFKYDRQPLRFNFMFYRPQDQWMIYKFAYDDSFDTELEESGKLYFLNTTVY